MDSDRLESIGIALSALMIPAGVVVALTAGPGSPLGIAAFWACLGVMGFLTVTIMVCRRLEGRW